jgi:uncharacterized membrane-anchored protein
MGETQMRQFIFVMLTAMILTSACYQEATAGCAKDDRICNDAVNNAAARQKAADDARTKELNRQNGASQYTGPTGGYDPKTQTVKGGYQWSTK